MKGQRLYTAQNSAIGNPGEFPNLALQTPILGFSSQGEMLESVEFASAIPNPQVLPPAVDVLPASGTAEESRRCEVGVEKVLPADLDPLSLPTSRGEVRGRPVGMQQHQARTNSIIPPSGPVATIIQ